MESKKLNRREFNKQSIAAVGGALGGAFLGACERTGAVAMGLIPAPWAKYRDRTLNRARARAKAAQERLSHHGTVRVTIRRPNRKADGV